MNPAEKLEQVGLERLHADADTIHPVGAVAGEVCTFHGAGIGFQSDFAGESIGNNTFARSRIRAMLDG